MKETLKRAMDVGVSRLAPLLIRVRPRKLILCYHRIAPDDGRGDAFLSPVSSVRVGELDRQLRWLSGFARFRTLDETVQGPSERDGRWQVSITFDDGYLDNFTLGQSLFERYQVPVTCFIATDYVAEPSLIPWWDLVNCVENTGHWLPDIDVAAEYAGPASRAQRHPLLQLRDAHERGPLHHAEALSTRITAHLRAHECLPRHNAMARPSTLARNVQSGLFRVAPHTARHVNLGLLPPREQVREIRRSYDQLATWGLAPTRWFAYPFGKSQARSDETVDVVRGLGFKGALTTEPGYVRQASDRYLLPRLAVDGRWPLQRFRTRAVAADLAARSLAPAPTRPSTAIVASSPSP